MDLIITGSRGFIGFNFLLEVEKNETFLDQYETIYLIDNCSLKDENGEIWNQINYEEFLRRNSEKFVDYFDCFKAMGKNKVDILNFASESHVDDSIVQPFALYQKNTSMLSELISGVGMDKIGTFYHIRTDEEFGMLEKVSDPAFNKDSKLNPRNPYAASKASQYLYLKSLQETFGMNVVCFCLANQYGPHQHFSKMIPATIKRIQKGEPALVYGNGLECREWTYVGDTVKEIADVIFTKRELKEKNIIARKSEYCGPVTEWDIALLDMKREYFISNPLGFTSNLELVQRIISIMGKGEIEFVENRKGHDFAYKLESDFELETNLQTGLEETIEHYLE